MLDQMRSRTGSLITYLLFTMIIIVFVFTFNSVGPSQACGGARGPGGPTRDLVEVGDVTIDTNTLRMGSALTMTPPSPRSQAPDTLQTDILYRRTRFFRSPLTTRFDEATAYVARFNRLPLAQVDMGVDPANVSPIKSEKVMDQLVETYLVAQLAEDQGLAVSYDELADRVLGESFFDKDTGAFDKRAWDNYVRYTIGTSPLKFEHFLRSELLREKLIASLVEGVTVSDDELAFYHRGANEKLDLAYVDVSDAAARDLVPVDDNELGTWISGHADDISKYYDAHKADYDKPKRAELRVVRVDAPNRKIIEATQEAADKAKMQADRDKARQDAQAILAELEAKMGAPEPADDAKPADEAEPADAKPADTKPARFITTDAFGAVAAAKSTDAASKVNQGLLPRAYSKEELGRYPFGKELAEAVFGLKPGVLSKLIEVDGGFFVVRVERFLAPEKKTLDQVRKEIARTLYAKEKASAFKKTLADELLAAAKAAADKPLSEVVKTVNAKHGAKEGAGLVARSTGPFGRLSAARVDATVGRVPGLGLAPELVKAAFAAPADKPLLDRVFELKDGRLVVARVGERTPAGELDKDAAAALRKQLVSQRQHLFYLGWYKDQLEKARSEGRVSESSDWNDIRAADRRAYAEAAGKGALPAPEAPAQPGAK